MHAIESATPSVQNSETTSTTKQRYSNLRMVSDETLRYSYQIWVTTGFLKLFSFLLTEQAYDDFYHQFIPSGINLV